MNQAVSKDGLAVKYLLSIERSANEALAVKYLLSIERSANEALAVKYFGLKIVVGTRMARMLH